MSSPLLEASIDGAHGVLLSFQASNSFGLNELSQAAQLVRESVDPNANIIIGQILQEEMGDEFRVTIIAAGFDENKEKAGSASGGKHAHQPSAPEALEVPERVAVVAI